MAVRIVTDSTCDLPRALRESLRITAVPCNIHFGSETLRDGVDIDCATFYSRLQQDSIRPTTSQPSVGQFLEAFRTVAQESNEILVVLISSKLSGTYVSATQAKGELKGARLEVFDSRQTSLGLGLLVQAVARLARDGATLDECLLFLHEQSSHIYTYFTVDTLTYLVRGGRPTRVQGLFGSLLDIKPVLELREGEVHPMDRVRSRQRSLTRLGDLVAARKGVRSVGVMHSVCPENAATVAEAARGTHPKAEVLLSEFTPVLGVHLGPRALGVGVWSES
ncbi:MAG: DegV family protein [Chloroflexi bacterium]|nr:DegV family protein [Chloroflexota bacterium]